MKNYAKPTSWTTHVWSLPAGERRHGRRCHFTVRVIVRVQLEVDEERRLGIVAQEVVELSRRAQRRHIVPAHEIHGKLAGRRDRDVAAGLEGLRGVLLP